jgi:hypothetical protein
MDISAQTMITAIKANLFEYFDYLGRSPQDDAVQGLWVDGEYAYLTGKTYSFSAGQDDALLLKVHIPSATFPPTP